MQNPMVILALIWGLGAHAQSSIDTIVEVTSPHGKAMGQKEVFDKAIEKVSSQFIEQLIGEAKATKNQTLIKNRILKNSGKYILFIKAQTPVTKDAEIRYPVSLKVSTKNLETLLLQEGLLYRMEGPPKLLPMVTFIDRVGSKMFSWWSPSDVADSRGFLPELAERFHRGLRKELRSKGFFALDPVAGEYAKLLPAALRFENPATEDLLLLTEFCRAQVVVRGQVVISALPSRADAFHLEVRMAALHAANGRIIGEVIRAYDTEVGPFNQVVKSKINEILDKLTSDLGGQILEAWKSGTFGASLLSVAVTGDLNYQQISQFKRLMLEQVKDLKTLKERLFEPGRVVFETDSSVNSEQLATTIRQKNFPRFQVSVGQVRPEGIELKVNTR